jgi:ATP/ADP translocase/HEAT repeat protein
VAFPVLESLFPVRQGERSLTLLLLLHNLFAVGAFVAGRSVRDALFLAHADRTELAWMYVASAAAVALAGIFYAPLSARVRRDRMAVGSALLFAAAFIAIWFAERRGASSVYYLLYVYVEWMGALTLVQFWTLANELFHAREARRLYGLIGSGGMIANILVGLTTARIATSLGTAALLWLCALLLVGCAAASFLAGRLGRHRLVARAASPRPSSLGRMAGGMSRVFASGHLRAVAALTVVTFFTTSLVDFQFKVIAADSQPRDELAAYFGYFSAAVGLLALCLQLFGTGRILGRVGVIGALSLLPSALGTGSIALALLPALWSATLVKGSDTLLRYTINDATSQILYLPVAPNGRASAKGFIEGVMKPASIGLAGLALIGYRSFFGGDPHRLAWVAVLLCGIWLAVVLSLRAGYLRSLQDNLRNRRLDLESAPWRLRDGSTNRVVTRALESGDPREVLHALEILPHLEDMELDHRIEALLDHPLPEIRIAALDCCQLRRSARFVHSIFRRFEDPDARVRAAAVDAFCSIGHDKAVRTVKAFLTDSDPAVRSAAVIGMIRYGGLDGILNAADALKQLISHEDGVMREHAARVLGAVGVSNFYQPVLELMTDRDSSVRRAAILAAGILKSPEFVAPLIHRARSPEHMREAVAALTQFGTGIIPSLGKVLTHRMEDVGTRWAVAKVLGRIGTAEAVAVLERNLDEPDESLRTQVFRSLARAVRGNRHLRADRRLVREALDGELLRSYRILMSAEVLRLGPGPGPYTPRRGPESSAAMLSSALQEKGVSTERRIFTLLAVLYPEAGMERIYVGIREASSAEDAARRRANAVELLDNLLHRDLKRKLLPLSDDVARADKLRAIEDNLDIPLLDPAAALAELCRDETAWVRACALNHAVELRHPDLERLLSEGVADSDPVVRETALLGWMHTEPVLAQAEAERRMEDDSPLVRRQAARIARLRTA